MRRVGLRPRWVLAALWAITAFAVAEPAAAQCLELSVDILDSTGKPPASGFFNPGQSIFVRLQVKSTCDFRTPANVPGGFFKTPFWQALTITRPDSLKILSSQTFHPDELQPSACQRGLTTVQVIPAENVTATGFIVEYKWDLLDTRFGYDLGLGGAPPGGFYKVIAQTSLGTGSLITDCVEKPGQWVDAFAVTPSTVLSNSAGFTIATSAPPTVACSVTPNTLSPPNHKLVQVTATVTVTPQVVGVATSFVLTSVTSNEPDEGLGDGDMPNDIQGFTIGTPDTTGLLRSERSGNGTGRIYTLTYTGTDAFGKSATGSCEVKVPL